MKEVKKTGRRCRLANLLSSSFPSLIYITSQDCVETAKKMKSTEKSKPKKKRKTEDGTPEEERPPIDFVIDIIIGLLERSNSFSRVLASQCFVKLTPAITSSTIDLILAVSRLCMQFFLKLMIVTAT